MPRKLIMCGDHPVLAFEYEPASGRACSSGEVIIGSYSAIESSGNV